MTCTAELACKCQLNLARKPKELKLF